MSERSAMTALLELDQLVIDVTGPDGRIRVVDGVSLVVGAGECVALVGESGAGKTLTARAGLGLLPPSVRLVSGAVRWHGRDIAGLSPRERRERLGREVAYISQEPALDPVMRVGRQLVEAMRVHGTPARVARRRVPELLAIVGIADASRRARAYPHQLSGGMQQRVMLALALANEPDLVIADEPTTALDVATQAQVLDVLARLRTRAGRGLLLVTHDLGVVAGVADRVLVMYAGRVVEQAPVDELLTSPRHPYTMALLGAVPRLGDRRGALRPISGSPPDAGQRPAGCAFHPRCPYAEEACRLAVPLLERLTSGHRVACRRVRELDDVFARGTSR